MSEPSPSPALRREIERFDADLPIEQAWTPPKSWYLDPQLYELERRRVLWRTWQPVASAEELRAPGAYRAGCFAGLPYVVIRGEDGALRAFHNVCSHKGREVVTGAGQATTLVCGYHAWSYGLDGSLRKAPRMAGIQDFDKEAMALRPMGCAVWGPWVFINGDPHAPSLSSQVPEVEARLGASGWEDLRLVARRSWTLRCNWKVYVDNYLDGGYHVPHMHPTLAAQIDMGSYRTELFARSSIQSSRPAASAGAELPYRVEDRIGDGALYAWLYPGFMINRYGPCMDSNWVIPLGVDRCEVRFELFFAPDAGASEAGRRFIEESIAQTEVTQVEDVEICESVQVGLGSPAYDRGRYAPTVEAGEWHFHRLLAADLRSP